MHSRDFKEGISVGISPVDKGSSVAEAAAACFQYENLLRHNSPSKNPELSRINPASWLDAAGSL